LDLRSYQKLRFEAVSGVGKLVSGPHKSALPRDEPRNCRHLGATLDRKPLICGAYVEQLQTEQPHRPRNAGAEASVISPDHSRPKSPKPTEHLSRAEMPAASLASLSRASVCEPPARHSPTANSKHPWAVRAKKNPCPVTRDQHRRPTLRELQ